MKKLFAGLLALACLAAPLARADGPPKFDFTLSAPAVAAPWKAAPPEIPRLDLKLSKRQASGGAGGDWSLTMLRDFQSHTWDACVVTTLGALTNKGKPTGLSWAGALGATVDKQGTALAATGVDYQHFFLDNLYARAGLGIKAQAGNQPGPHVGFVGWIGIAYRFLSK